MISEPIIQHEGMTADMTKLHDDTGTPADGVSLP